MYEGVVILDKDKRDVILLKLEPKDRAEAKNNPLKQFNIMFKELTDLYGNPSSLYDEKETWMPHLNHVVRQLCWKTKEGNESLMIILNLLKDVSWDLSFDDETHQPALVFVDIMPSKTMDYMVNSRFDKTVQLMHGVKDNCAKKENKCESCFFDKPWDLVKGLDVETKKNVKYIREGYSVNTLYKMEGNDIYCGQTNKLLFKIEDNSVKDAVSGKSVCDIDGHAVKSPTGKLLCIIDGDFLRQEGSDNVLYTIR